MSDEPADPAPDEPDAPRQRAAWGEKPTERLEPAATSSPAPPKVVVPRWVQLGALPVALLGVWALARAAGVVLLVFVIAAVIALMLNPLVKAVHRGKRFPRGLAVAVVYLGFFLVLAGGVALLINPVTDQVKRLQRDVPNLAKPRHPAGHRRRQRRIRARHARRRPWTSRWPAGACRVEPSSGRPRRALSPPP